MRNLSITTRWMLALVVVAAIGVAYFMRNKSRGDDGASATMSTVASVAEPAQRVDPTVDVDAALERPDADSERTAVPEPEEESAQPKPREGSGKVWKGRVEFVGLGREFGTTLEERDLGINRLTLGFECFGRTYPEVVELSLDTFECEVPFAEEDIERVRVLHASAQGGHWLPEAGFEMLSRDFDAPVVVRLVRAPPTRLKVVDARTGEMLGTFHLNSGQISAVNGWGRTFFQEIVDVGDLVEETESDGTARLRLSAEGRVTRMLEFDLDVGGMHEIRMERAGSARTSWTVPEELQPVLWSRRDRPTLHVQLQPDAGRGSPRGSPFDAPELSAVGSAVEQRESKDGLPASVSAKIQGVAPGEYRAVLQVSGTRFTKARELAAAMVVVRADETAEVELATLPDHGFPASEWTFEVVIPEGYGDFRNPRLVLRAPTPQRSSWTSLVARETAPRVWRSAPIRADPGSVLVGLSIDPTCEVPVELDGSPTTPVRVAIPEPLRFRVRLRSRTSEPPPLPSVLLWRSSPSNKNQPGERVSPRDGVFEICAAGPAIEVALPHAVSLRLAEPGWVTLEGGGDHALDVVPGPCVRLALFDAGQPVDVGIAFASVRARGPDGRKRPLDTRRVRPLPGAAHELLVWFREPGGHELQLNSIPGFEPLAPLKLTVSEGPERIVHIDLVRKR
ncbi:MAG: hypothetical protein NTV21_15960 [Planctomycetota bacterium]|nr:hypothetical protein [Planctomycetota bacterium]